MWFTMRKKYLFIRKDKKCKKLLYTDILYVEAEGRYVNIVTAKTVHLLLLSITEIEKKLPEDMFCRVHRSYIISLEHTTEFDHEEVIVADRSLPISKAYKNSLSKIVDVLCCEMNGVNEMSEKERKKLAEAIKTNKN